jgi:hypothetical protein
MPIISYHIDDCIICYTNVYKYQMCLHLEIYNCHTIMGKKDIIIPISGSHEALETKC